MHPRLGGRPRRSVDYTDAAVELWPHIAEWWGMQDSAVSETGTGHNIINVYAGGLTYFSGGIGGGKYAKGSQENRGFGISWSAGQSLAFGHWLYLDHGADSNTSFGMGHPSIGTDPYGCSNVVRSGGTTTIKVIAYDFGVPGMVSGPTFDVTGKARIFCLFVYNGSTRKFDLYVGDDENAPVLASWLTFSAEPDPNYNWGAVCWRNNGGSAFDPIPHGVDEFFTVSNFLLGESHRLLLWNGGAGLTYPQLDAIVP